MIENEIRETTNKEIRPMARLTALETSIYTIIKDRGDWTVDTVPQNTKKVILRLVRKGVVVFDETYRTYVVAPAYDHAAWLKEHDRWMALSKEERAVALARRFTVQGFAVSTAAPVLKTTITRNGLRDLQTWIAQNRGSLLDGTSIFFTGEDSGLTWQSTISEVMAYRSEV